MDVYKSNVSPSPILNPYFDPFSFGTFSEESVVQMYKSESLFDPLKLKVSLGPTLQENMPKPIFTLKKLKLIEFKFM